MVTKLNRMDAEFWKKILVDRCEACNGRGVVAMTGETSVEVCKCMRMVRLMVKMNDPAHGIKLEHQNYQLDDLDGLDIKSKSLINQYLSILSRPAKYNEPYANSIIRSSKNGGKSTVAAIIYKHLMKREYNVSVFSFSEIANLCKNYASNIRMFNEGLGLYELLKEEEFIIIENVDDTFDSDFNYIQKIGYVLLDELFAFRANHPRRATIITTDSDLAISTQTLGRVYYESIYLTNVESDRLFRINLNGMSSDLVPDVISKKDKDFKRASPVKKKANTAMKKPSSTKKLPTVEGGPLELEKNWYDE